MSQFKVGGKVVCIESCILMSSDKNEFFSYKIGETYTFKKVDVCKCGIVSLSFGQFRGYHPRYENYCYCECGIEVKTSEVFVSAQYFVPIEEQEYKQVSYTKIINEIPTCAQ